MRVLHLLSSTGYHGAETMAAELVRQLTKLGVRNHVGVFVSNTSSNKQILEVVAPYVEHSTIFSCRGKFDLRTVHSLRQYLLDQQIDIIHSHKYKTNFYSLFSHVGTSCKLISTCHNWLVGSANLRLYAALDKRVLRFFDAAVGVSDEIIKELQKYMPAQKVHKIENGIDTAKFSGNVDRHQAKTHLGLPRGKLVGFVGRLSADKGISYLLRAIHELNLRGNDICAVIVGDGDYKESLIADVQALGMTDSVILLGNRNDTPLLYPAFDVFVLPSLKEAFPMVILEAMACKTPIVATQVGDIYRIIENDRSGLLVQPGDAHSLSIAINELLHDQDKVEQLTMTARERVETLFSSSIMAAKYELLYKKTLGRV